MRGQPQVVAPQPSGKIVLQEGAILHLHLRQNLFQGLFPHVVGIRGGRLLLLLRFRGGISIIPGGRCLSVIQIRRSLAGRWLCHHEIAVFQLVLQLHHPSGKIILHPADSGRKVPNVIGEIRLTQVDQAQFAVQPLILAGLKAVGRLLHQVNDPKKLRRREFLRQFCGFLGGAGAGDHAKPCLGSRFDHQHIPGQGGKLIQHGRSVFSLTVELRKQG